MGQEGCKDPVKVEGQEALFCDLGDHLAAAWSSHVWVGAVSAPRKPTVAAG